MRIISLIGTLAMLLLPFAFISYTIGDVASFRQFLSFLWVQSSGELQLGPFGGQSSHSEAFSFEWFGEGGQYHSFFGDLMILGIIVLILLLANILISATATDRKNKSIPGIILIVCGVLLLIIRLSVLSDSNLSIYESTNTSTYIEVPIGFILGLIFGILDLRGK